MEGDVKLIKIERGWFSNKEGINPQNKLKGVQIAESDKAKKFKTKNYGKIWIPTSQIENVETEPPEFVNIEDILPTSSKLVVRILGTVVDIHNSKKRYKFDDGSGITTLVFSEKPSTDIDLGTEMEVWGTPLEVNNTPEFHVHNLKKIEVG